MIRPRPYQSDALTAVEEKLAAHQSTIAVMATGLGKTILFGLLADRMRHQGRVMILAHREELIDQAADKVGRVCGCPVDVEMADRRASNLIKAPIVVSSIQTQTAGTNGNRRMLKFDPNEFSLVVVDEFHHAAADTYKDTLAHYASNPNLRVLGVTATPKRTDQKALAVVCDSVAFRMGIVDGIEEGWLVPIEQRFVRIEGLDYGQIQVRLGDFVVGSLSQAMRHPKVIEAVCAAVHQYCDSRKSLVFCVDVEHAENVTLVLNQYSPGYAHIVTGATPTTERRQIINDYRAGRFPCLVNCMVATEGFDVPDIQTVVMARPTQSPLLYEQMLGRGTRPVADVDSAGNADNRKARIASSIKPKMLVVDFVGNCKHRIVTAIDVLGGRMSDAAKERARQRMEEGGGGDVLDEGRRADSELQAEAKTRHAKALTRDVEVSPFGPRNDPFKTFGLQYEKGRTPIEAWQKEKLEGWRMPTPDTAEEAQDLIDEVRSRTRRGLCTFRMAKLVTQWGYDGRNMPFEQAKKLIGERLGT